MGKTQKPIGPRQRGGGEEETPQETLQRLIREQGVKPYKVDFEEIDKRWTPEYNFDGFLEWYAQYKAEQRSRPRKNKLP